MKTAIVYGPIGCGKTSHAHLIAQLLGIPADNIVDDWTSTPAGRAIPRLKPGYLHLSADEFQAEDGPQITIRSFDSFNFPRFTPNLDAVRQMGLGMIGSEIILERFRQIEEYDYDAAHDDDHRQGEIAAMAAAYSQLSTDHENEAVQQHVQGELWPWDETMPRHHSRRDLLITAAALLVAEIERIDRAATPAEQEG
ncbi:hypothetical protein [Novosphingobium sp.]|uniref:hypothetical protein n=1 Tax=Novosphingobium sp. TaxID=1874826 RepID=UPI0031D659D7